MSLWKRIGAAIQDWWDEIRGKEKPRPPVDEIKPAPVQFRWNGSSATVGTGWKLRRIYAVYHSDRNGRKYYPDAKFHKLIVPVVTNAPAVDIPPSKLVNEGLAQICATDTREPMADAVWLVQPGVPCESLITYEEWSEGHHDNIILKLGRSH